MHYTTIGYLRVGPKTDDIKKFVVLRIVISREGRQLEGTLARFSGPWVWLNIRLSRISGTPSWSISNEAFKHAD